MEINKIEPIQIEQMEERQEAASANTEIGGKVTYNDKKVGGEISFKISF